MVLSSAGYSETQAKRQIAARVFSVANQKGGVGKTTTSVNLAASIAAFKKNVLLIDIDPQGNATTGSGVDKFSLDKTSCEALLGENILLDGVVSSVEGGFDLLPANSSLTAAELELMNVDNRAEKLHLALADARDVYDYIFIDCPPSLNILTVNALCASDGVIVPLQCEFYALEGISALMDTIKKIRQSVNSRLNIEGVVRTMYDSRNNLSIEVSQQLLDYFGDKVYKTIIPRNVRVAEAPSYGKPITVYDPSSRGAYAYMDLAAEILEKHNG